MAKISLIMATVDRTAEIQRFMFQLDAQEYGDLELIVVDQNLDDRLVPILGGFSDRFSIKHIRTNKRGVSRARNLGIKEAQGDIIAFPDDDCWYPKGFLNQLEEIFDQYPQYDGFIGMVLDQDGLPISKRYSSARPMMVDRINIWIVGNTNAMFFRNRVVDQTGYFDEMLGPGVENSWRAAEDVEYSLRVMSSGFMIYYLPKMEVGHPNPIRVITDKSFQRAFTYGASMGKVLRDYQYPLWFELYQLSRSLGAMIINFMKGDFLRMRLYWITFKGRVYGLLHPRAEK